MPFAAARRAQQFVLSFCVNITINITRKSGIPFRWIARKPINNTSKFESVRKQRVQFSALRQVTVLERYGSTCSLNTVVLPDSDRTSFSRQAVETIPALDLKPSNTLHSCARWSSFVSPKRSRSDNSKHWQVEVTCSKRRFPQCKSTSA